MRELTNADEARPAVTIQTRAPDAGEEHSAGGPTTEIDRLRFDLLRSAMYHDLRENRLAFIHKALTFCNILLGSGAILGFGANVPIVGQVAGAAVAVIGAAQLVWDFTGRSRDHKELKRRFYGLLSDADDSCDIQAIRSKETLIFADEPPIHRKANKIAHDAAGQSLFGDNFNRA